MYPLAEDYWGHYIKVDRMGKTSVGKKTHKTMVTKISKEDRTYAT